GGPAHPDANAPAFRRALHRYSAAFMHSASWRGSCSSSFLAGTLAVAGVGSNPNRAWFISSSEGVFFVADLRGGSVGHTALAQPATGANFSERSALESATPPARRGRRPEFSDRLLFAPPGSEPQPRRLLRRRGPVPWSCAGLHSRPVTSAHRLTVPGPAGGDCHS